MAEIFSMLMASMNHDLHNRSWMPITVVLMPPMPECSGQGPASHGSVMRLQWPYHYFYPAFNAHDRLDIHIDSLNKPPDDVVTMTPIRDVLESLLDTFDRASAEYCLASNTADPLNSNYLSPTAWPQYRQSYQYGLSLHSRRYTGWSRRSSSVQYVLVGLPWQGNRTFRSFALLSVRVYQEPSP